MIKTRRSPRHCSHHRECYLLLSSARDKETPALRVAKACLAWEQPSILRTVTLLTIMTSHHKFLILSIYQSNLQEFHTNYIIYFLWEPSLQGTLAVTILAKEIFVRIIKVSRLFKKEINFGASIVA